MLTIHGSLDFVRFEWLMLRLTPLSRERFLLQVCSFGSESSPVEVGEELEIETLLAAV